ncbi:MAG: winged helix-turn-helix transcriptional regulator [Actinobacteria bacterium]|nr:winged helix-turn-helix transcriptional regulator [Actinomycetota bacterium]
MENTILEFKRRREIYEFISQNSGLHMRDISRKLNVPFTSLKYHLNYLEKKGFIISRDDGKYSRYFISLEIGEKEKRILNCLRKRTTLHIILWFFIAVQCSQKDISRFLEKHPTTISFHLRKMIQAGIIEQVSIDKGIIYNETPPIIINRPQVSSVKIYVLQDPWMIYDLLIKNKENLGDKEVVTGIIEYVEFIISEGIPKQIQNREDTKESILNTFYKFFFPPSFCS